MNTFILLAVNFVLFFGSTSSVIIDCNYNSNTAYEVIGNVYQCEVKNNLNIKTKEDAVIDYANGTHVGSKTSDDVKSFHAMRKNVDFFPRGLEKMFKNLISIYIPYGRIKELRQADLKPFPKLVYLDFGESVIRVIEEGTFDFNPNLEVVWLVLNKLFHIDPNVFKNLNKLSFLGLRSNPCINTDVRNNLGQVVNLIDSVNKNCFDEDFFKISQDLKSLESEAKVLKLDNFENWNDRLESLEENFKNSRFTNLNILTERFEKLKQKLAVLKIYFLNQVEQNLKNHQIESCSVLDGKLSEFEDKFAFSDQTLIQINQKFNKTDEKITNFEDKSSNIIEKFNRCENIRNFSPIIYNKLENMELDQQNIKSQVQELNRKLEEQFAKIEEKARKIVKAFQD